MIVEKDNNGNYNKSKRRKLDFKDIDIIEFKNELLQYLHGKSYSYYGGIESDEGTEAEKLIKNLCLWLRKTYSYEVLRQLFCLKEINEVLSIDVYWFLHMAYTLHFSDYIVNIENDKLIKYIREAISEYIIVNDVDTMLTSISSSIILFLFDITINYSDENCENKKIISNQIGSSQFSFNKLLDCNKCHQILEEIVINTNNSNIFEYSNSTKDLNDAIKNTRNLKKMKINSDNIKNFELDQSPLQPVYIGNIEFQIFIMVLKIIARSSNVTAVKEWWIRQLCRLSSCILKSSESFDCNLLDDIHELLLLAINKELRSTSVSSLDFTFNTWLTESCKANETAGISLLLNKLLTITIDNRKVINYEMIERLIKLATSAASDGVAEDSSIQWLRSVCLIQQITLITQTFEDISHSNKVEIGFKLLSNWFDIVLGPNSKQQELDIVEHPINSKSFGFACLAFCEIVDVVSEECLQLMCNAVRSRKDLNKDAADSFLQVGRTQLKFFVALRKGNSDNKISRAGIDITEDRVIQWCRTLDSTGNLPAAIHQQCKLIGLNGYKVLMISMKSLIADNPAIRDSCNKIVMAMSNPKNSLCSIAEAKEFVADEITYEGKLDVVLATLSIPALCKVHVKSALQALQTMNGNASKVVDSSTNTSNILLSCLETWKSSCRQAIQSINTITPSCDLRLKITGLLIMNILQSITLLASQLHIFLSSSPLTSNVSFVFWYEWIYEAVDIFSNDNDAVDSISSIMCSYLIGDSTGIIQFPGLALFLSIASEIFVSKLLSSIFVNFSEIMSDFNDSISQKLCGLLHGALTWSSHSFNAYNDNSFLLGDYLKAFRPLLSATYIWIYNSIQTPLPCDFSDLLDKICPIITNFHGNNNCCALKLISSPIFNTIFQWIVRYRDLFGRNCVDYKMQSLLFMMLNTLGCEVDVSNMKSVKELDETYRAQLTSCPNDYIIYWHKLVDCVTPVIELNLLGKACMDEKITRAIRSLIRIIAREVDLYKNDIWKIWMKSAKLEIEIYGNHRKSSILLLLSLIVLNEGNHDNSFMINSIKLSEYTLWCSYLLSSKHMAISKSINIDLCDCYAILHTLSPHLSSSILGHQIPLLISSEVCNQIINLGSKLYSKIQINISMTTMNGFVQCIIEDISFLLLCNTSLDSLQLFRSEKNLYARSLGWSFLSAASICVINEQIVKKCLRKIIEFYKVASNEKKHKILAFLVALISSFTLSPSSFIPLISILLKENFLESSKIIELVSEELCSQLPCDIAMEEIEKLKEIKIDT